MAEGYFDTQALLGVVIRDPTILGADITGKTLSINENYDWPASGKPFLPGYYFGLTRGGGFSVYYANDAVSGGLVMSMQPGHPDADEPWFFDRLTINGGFRGDFIEDSAHISGKVVARETTQWTEQEIGGQTLWTGWGTQMAGQVIVTDQKVLYPYEKDGSGFYEMVDEPAALGVSSRAYFDFNPQNVTKLSAMVMHSSNQGDMEFDSKDTILEIDKAGASVTPKIGPGASPSSIKVISGQESGMADRASIELSAGSSLGEIDVYGITTVHNALIIPEPIQDDHAATKAYVDANAGGGGGLNIVELGSGVDLNTLTSPGRYWQTENSEALSGANYPAGYAGFLEVVANDGETELLQIYTTYNAPSAAAGASYMRNRYQGVWSPWVIMYYDSGWVDLTLASGWIPSAAAGQAPTVQCRRVNNVVRFRGRASGTLNVGTTTQIATIPAGYRPIIDSNMVAIGTTGGFTGWANATSTGVLSVHFKSPYASGATVLEFTGMSYLVN